MPTSYIEAISYTPGSFDWAFYGQSGESTALQCVQGTAHDGSDYGNKGYVYAFGDGQQFTITMDYIPSSASTSQVVVWFCGDNYTFGGDGEQINVELFINGAWRAAQALPNFNGGLGSVTFSGLSGAFSGVKVRVTYADPNGYQNGANFYHVYVAATYTQSPASATILSGPSTGGIGYASSSFTATLNGTSATGLTATPSDNGGGGTFSPASLTLSDSTPSGTFTYTAASYGSKTITVALSGLSTSNSVAYLADYLIPVANFSFETPSTAGATNNITSQPTGASWTFGNRSGVASPNASGFNPGATPPDGAQFAYLQSYNNETPGSVSQVISGLTVGTQYTVKVAMTQRTNFVTAANPISVYWDATKIGSTVTPATQTWVDYTFGPFTATATSHTLKITGGPLTGDQSTLIDNVRLSYSTGGGSSGSSQKKSLFFFGSP